MPKLRPFTPSADIDEDDESNPQSYEGLLISALVESGRFNPEAYNVTSDDIVGWGKVWAFCRDYQESAGGAPLPGLLAAMHPEFTLTEGVSPRWAAKMVLDQSAARDLRIRTRESLAALREGDVDTAFEQLEGLERPRGQHQQPASLFDVSKVLKPFDADRIEVPYPSLRRMLKGGLEPTEYMVLAARLAQGKSHQMCHFASTAIATGWRVAVVSLEMPARQVNLRTLRHLCGSNRSLFEQLRGDDEIEMKKAVDQLREMTPGHLDVFDPSHGNIGTTGMVSDLARDYDMVCVDHLGLMKTKKQQRAIEDWRVQAHISNVIREIALESESRILALAQINRAGEHAGSSAVPRPSELAQADAIGQDATAVLTFKRLSKKVTKFGLQKSREGDTGTFYARFDPAENRFDELSKERALEISAYDDSLDD
jgi:hypothetical protein